MPRFSPFRAELVRRGLNFYRPYRASGARIKRISRDFREVIVEIELNWFNRNLVGTLFGGSMYTAVDPIYMMMFIQNLGTDYIVWDKSATIRFVKPGRKTVTGVHRITQAQIDGVKARLEHERAFTETFTVSLIDTDGITVAEIDKELYFSKQNSGGKQKVRSLFSKLFD